MAFELNTNSFEEFKEQMEWIMTEVGQREYAYMLYDEACRSGKFTVLLGESGDEMMGYYAQTLGEIITLYGMVGEALDPDAESDGKKFCEKLDQIINNLNTVKASILAAMAKEHFTE